MWAPEITHTMKEKDEKKNVSIQTCLHKNTFILCEEDYRDCQKQFTIPFGNGTQMFGELLYKHRCKSLSH